MEARPAKRKPRHFARAFDIDSYGNGLFYRIVRRADAASVFLQGDDAIELHHELSQTTERRADEDVVSRYFS